MMGKQNNKLPIVKINLINYDTLHQAEYSKKFMQPLMKNLLKKFAKTKNEDVTI